MDRQYTRLNQFDTEEGDFDSLDSISAELSSEIGELLIVFSGLEHSINFVVSTMINERFHDHGYRILMTLKMGDKIEFLYGILLQFISETEQGDRKEELKKLVERLKKVNTFRNKVAHANWGTLKKDGNVRTKITMDSGDGGIRFENVKITRSILVKNIKETDKLILEIDDFFMDVKEKITFSPTEVVN
jgi:pimeloyl-CoA synthetase